ncbi:PAS domain-containing sensor histidine kinase [Synechococcus sp. PCC 7336]|uniref:sensor histidine kinase n=1 Tax=Synechococcus sp. PCC 7336 TaxID=195250 RepID=UPI000349E54E|nr:PAS domain-containing sensor histidine kinase [Synechococcus sp. PCC 7336]
MKSALDLLNSLSVGVVCTDRSGKVLVWNAPMLEMTGIAAEAMVGHPLSQSFPQLQEIAERSSLHQSAVAIAASLKSQPMQAGHPHATDTSPVLEFKAIARDCPPDLKQAEGWHRLWTFQPRQQQLEQAHTDFVATVSHELRTPLTSIKGFVDTLLQCHGQLSDLQQERFLSIVKDQADRLIHMVEDVLLVSRIQSGRLHNSPQQLALSEAFDRVLSAFPPDTQARIELELLPDLPTVWADPYRLDQILANLLDNALKYSEPDTSVTVKAGLHAADPNRVSIEIADSGMGMSEEQLIHLFTRFNHIESPLTRDRAGPGLGLYITKSLVESFGGHIDIESQLDRGTTCHIDLPSTPGIRWIPPGAPEDRSEPVPEWANSLL